MLYAIRYRCYRPDGSTALILEDLCGKAYLFAAGRLQCSIERGDTVARLLTLLASYAAWIEVPAVAPYTLNELVVLLPTAVPSFLRAA